MPHVAGPDFKAQRLCDCWFWIVVQPALAQSSALPPVVTAATTAAAAAGTTATATATAADTTAAASFVANATLQLTLSGTVADFVPVKLDSIRDDLAGLEKVGPSSVIVDANVSAAAGGVVVLATMPADQAADAVVKFRTGNLKTLGFMQVWELHLLMRPTRAWPFRIFVRETQL